MHERVDLDLRFRADLRWASPHHLQTAGEITKVAVQVRRRGGARADEDEYQQLLSDLAACGSAHKPASLSIIGNRWLQKGPQTYRGSLGWGGRPSFKPTRRRNQREPALQFSSLTPKHQH